MTKFSRWLQNESRGLKVIFMTLGCAVVLLIYMSISFWLIDILDIKIPPAFKILRIAPEIFYSYWLPIIIAVVVIEEILYRFLPVWICAKKTESSRAIILIMVISSIVFGLVHGGYHYIFIHGVYGFFLGVTFLKCGGFQKRYLKATAVTAMAHVIFTASMTEYMLLTL